MDKPLGLERLWAGWRSEYVTNQTDSKKNNCVMCYLYNSDDFKRDFVIYRNDFGAISLNLYPYGSGHLLIFGKSHVGSLESVPEQESIEIWELIKKALILLKHIYKPDGMNLGANIEKAGGAGIPEHIHFHALPRWVGDTNFMTTVAETRVLPESISESWAKLTQGWQELFS
jgi:ATP adenylyltransferase